YLRLGGPSSQSIPSQRRSFKISCSDCSVERSRSVSSIRRMNAPRLWRAKSHANNPERTLPMCSDPVGLGAKRVRTVTISLPFDRRRRLGSDVVDHAVDTFGLVGDAA